MSAALRILIATGSKLGGTRLATVASSSRKAANDINEALVRPLEAALSA